MPGFARDEWQLSLNEVYPRQAIYGFQLAPDGQRLSFVLQRDKRAEEVAEEGRKKVKEKPLADLCLIPSDGGYPRPLTDFGDASNPAMWSPDGKWLAFEREEGLLQIMPATGGKAKTIYKGKLYHPPLKAGDAYLGYPHWSPDGNSIVFATHAELKTTLQLVSADGRLQRELFSVEGYIIGWDWSPDGQRMVLVTRNEDGWTGDIRLLDVEASEACVLWEEDNYEYRKPVAVWTPDGEHFVFRSNRSGWAKLWVATPGGEPRPLTAGDWDDYAFRFSPDGKQVVYASRAEQNGSGDDLWITPLSGGEPKKLTQHPGVNVPLAWSKDDRIFYWHSSPVEPGDLWVVSANGGEPKRLTRSAPIELERKLRAPVEASIKNDDDTEIPALIYLPVYYQKNQRYPAIVWIRGGPTGIRRYEFAPFYSWLANQGYVVITPNYRGGIGYGVKHMAAVAGEGLGKNDLNDVLAAGRYVRTLPYVDLTRGVGVGGRSWGGYLTLMAVTQAPEDFSCAVAGTAISDWFIQQAQTEVRYYDRWLVGGWVYEQAERARERSPVSFVERIKAPLLVYHGEEDRDVPFSQIGPFVEKARQAGVDVEYVTYPTEGHSNKKPENQQDTLNRISNFFRRHLQPWDFRENPSGEQIQY
jgi:dipeptidyl aminopeptidase/acylaminoacyl peptidase